MSVDHGCGCIPCSCYGRLRRYVKVEPIDLLKAGCCSVNSKLCLSCLTHPSNNSCWGEAFIVAIPAGTVLCPLCRDILPSNDEADWKLHLLSGSGCPMNKKSHSRSERKISLHSPTRELPPQVSASHRLSYKTPISTPTSPLSSSSSSSTRYEPSVRNRGSTFSTATS
jgi:hypothetical protein